MGNHRPKHPTQPNLASCWRLGEGQTPRFLALSSQFVLFRPASLLATQVAPTAASSRTGRIPILSVFGGK
jgi:hypothetical protein